jgi:hypothetical protein
MEMASEQVRLVLWFCAQERAMSRTLLRYFIYTLAGPLANLGTALLAIQVAKQETTIGGVAKYFMAGSVLLGAGNLLPFKRKNLESDGSKLIALLFSKERRNALLFRLTLLARIQEVRTLHHNGQIQLACNKAEEISMRSERIPELMASADYRRHLADFQSELRKLALSSKDGEKAI